MKNFLFLLALLTPLFLSAQMNIQWRGTDRTGVYHEEGLLEKWPENGPELKWHYEDLGEGHSSVAIDSDRIYLTGLKGDQGYIYVFDLDGNLVKKKEYGPEWSESYVGPRGTVTINDSKIYLITGYGVLYCLDHQSLDLIWKRDFLKEYNAENTKWGINEAPLVVGDMVIATPGGKKGNLVAYDKNTGKTIWTSAGEGDRSAYCSPLYISDQEVPQIVTHTADHIIGVEANTGKKLWSYPQPNRYSVHANTPVYHNNMILCTSGYGKGSVMLRLTDGGRNVEKVWESDELDNRIGGMVKIGDYVYGSGDSNRYWFCADWKTGEIKYKKGGFGMGNIIANGDMLYCYTDRGNMLLARATPEEFDVISKFRISYGSAQHWAHTVLYKGLMLMRHGESLVVYEVK